MKAAYSARMDGQEVAVVEILDKRHSQLFTKKILAWIKIPPHPRLVRLVGVSLDAARELLVLELAPLGTLSEALQRIGTMPMRHKLVALQQVCAGMEALVAMGMAHGHLALHTVLTFRYVAEDAAATSVKLLNISVSAGDAVPVRCMLQSSPPHPLDISQAPARPPPPVSHRT